MGHSKSTIARNFQFLTPLPPQRTFLFLLPVPPPPKRTFALVNYPTPSQKKVQRRL